MGKNRKLNEVDTMDVTMAIAIENVLWLEEMMDTLDAINIEMGIQEEWNIHKILHIILTQTRKHPETFSNMCKAHFSKEK